MSRIISIICVFVACFASSVLCRTSESLKVKTDNGILVGRHLTTHNGRPIRAFMGIPYAQPPIGPLRFKVPQLTNCYSSLTNLNCNVVDKKNKFLIRRRLRWCRCLSLPAPSLGVFSQLSTGLSCLPLKPVSDQLISLTVFRRRRLIEMDGDLEQTTYNFCFLPSRRNLINLHATNSICFLFAIENLQIINHNVICELRCLQFDIAI